MLAIGVKIDSWADEYAAAINPRVFGRAAAPTRTDAAVPASAIEGSIDIAVFHSTARGFLAGMEI